MAWLPGWGKRIKLTIDNTKVDADLSHFPVTVFLSSTHGDCVFDELTADANRFKIAFTKDDGTTELYGEIEKWDDANESAIIHVSGWAISSSANTDFYMYYDIDHADNTTYIGDIASTPAASVYDANFKMVQHMKDNTTSAILDSTSNNNDGTKKAVNEPIEADGKVSKGQDFDAIDDYISVPDDVTLKPTSITITAVIKTNTIDTGATYRTIVDRREPSTPAYGYLLHTEGSTGKLRAIVYNSNGTTNGLRLNTTNVRDANWHIVAITYDETGGTLNVYVDGALDNGTLVGTPSGAIGYTAARSLYLGDQQGQTQRWNGIIDETRISSVVRTAAWIKATKETLWDTLLTYGSEELAAGHPTMLRTRRIAHMNYIGGH